jgi:outer membrane protein TolC
MKRLLLYLVVWVGFCVAAPASGWALTLEESIELAKKNLPSYRAAEQSVLSREALYKATLGPYLPSLDADAAHTIHDTSSQYYDANTYGLSASYKLFDGGKRRADRDTAALNLSSEREALRKSLQDLVLSVKISFYTAVAGREIILQRKSQLEYARKDFEVADGRYRLGAARLSEVLQASVRVEQARYNLIQAEGNFAKAVSELYSLIGLAPPEGSAELNGGLEAAGMLPARTVLRDAVLRRPEILQARYALDRTKKAKDSVTSEFFPTVSASLGYSRTTDNGATGNPSQDRVAMLSASWNLFELGKFYRRKSSEVEIRVSEESLRELQRQLSLDLEKNYEDFVTADRNVSVAAEQLRQAEQNYDQAFGEYKVGKGDILSLVQAETLLATAREQTTSARLNRILAEAQVERTAGTAAPAAASPDNGSGAFRP